MDVWKDVWMAGPWADALGRLRVEQLDGHLAFLLAVMKVLSMASLLAWRGDLLKVVWKEFLMAHELDRRTVGKWESYTASLKAWWKGGRWGCTRGGAWETLKVEKMDSLWAVRRAVWKVGERDSEKVVLWAVSTADRTAG